MCQSKSDGGVRCESHVKKAVAEHQIAYNKLVEQECASKGITIAPASYELTPDEKANVRAQFSADAKVKEAREGTNRATQKLNRVKGTINDALATGDINRIATVIRQHNPEMQSILDDYEARRRKLAADLANAATDEEKEEITANDRKQIELLNRRKQELNNASKKEAVEAAKIYRMRGAGPALESLTCVQQAQAEAKDARDKLAATTKSAGTRIEQAALANKLINDPGFQEAASSESFRNSAEFHKWQAKDRELAESYRMTSAYQNQVAARISAYKQAGMDTTEMEAAYKALTVRKAKFVYQNVVEANGLGSPAAQLARAAYDEAKAKEYSF